MHRLSLRAKLVGSVLLVLIPLLGLGAWGLAAAWETRNDILQQDLMQTAQVAGVLVDRSLEGWVTFAEFVADDLEDELGDGVAEPTGGRRFPEGATLEAFRRISAVVPGILNLALADRQGVLSVMSRGDRTGTLAVSDRQYFKDVLQTGEPAISNLVRGRVIGRPGFIAAAPIGPRGQDPQAVLLVSVQLEQLRAQLENIELREGQSLFLLDPVGRLAFQNSHEALRWREETLEDDPVVKRALAGEAVFSPNFPSFETGEPVLAALAPSKQMGWVVGVTISHDLAFIRLGESWRFQVLASALIALLSVGVALIGATLLSRRIHNLGAHARELASGNLEARILTRGPEGHAAGDDLDVLAREFNQMADSLQEERRRRELFVAAIVHDLRNLMNPLALHVRMLEMPETLNPERMAKLRSRLSTQVARANRLVSDLLDLSRMEAGQFELQFGEVDLEQVVRRVVEEQEPEVRDRLTVHCPGPVVLQGDVDRLGQVLTNLVSNAAKYSPEGGPIQVRVERGPELVTVEVEDEGLGLGAGELTRLFSPWERLRPEGQIRGIGLGLFICRTIIEGHGGSISARSRGPGMGSIFRFELPLRPRG